MDSDCLLLWPQLLPPNHKFIFFKVSKSSDDERLHPASIFWMKIPSHKHTTSPKSTQRGGWGVCIFSAIVLGWFFFFPPYLHCWEKSLLEYFLVYIVRNLCWCAWVGHLVLFLFAFFKKDHLPKLLLTLSST